MNRFQRTFPPQLLNYASHRCLSVSETAIALRPLFFMVHPDLFGKFPKEQVITVVNVNSEIHEEQNILVKSNGFWAD